jgi:outer membrane protein assembly factor BamB
MFVIHRLGAAALTFLGLASLPTRLSSDDWPQWGGLRRDGVWREDHIVEKLPAKLEPAWRREIGAGYSGPAVARGRVFVTDRILEEGESNPDNPFDRSRSVKGFERILSLDAKTGDLIWKHTWRKDYEISYPSGPRATPTVSGDLVFALGAMGDLFALDFATGELRWSKNFVTDFGTEMNTWGSSASPLVDGDRLIVLVGGKDGAGVVAFDTKTGKEIWRALKLADPGYSPPVIVDGTVPRQLIVYTPEAVVSLDPMSGREFWREAFAVQSSLSIAAPVFDALTRRLLVTAFYNGSVLLELDAKEPRARVVWRGSSSSERETDGLHGLMSTPIIRGEHIYGVCSYGQLRCLETATGKRVWETLQATGEGRWWNAFIVPQGDRFFIANEQGDLIIAQLTPRGYIEESRAFLIQPTSRAQRREIVWSHPAFADRAVFARNDREIIRVDLDKRD